MGRRYQVGYKMIEKKVGGEVGRENWRKLIK
jgi:hypothetical protein